VLEVEFTDPDMENITCEDEFEAVECILEAYPEAEFSEWNRKTRLIWVGNWIAARMSIRSDE